VDNWFGQKNFPFQKLYKEACMAAPSHIHTKAMEIMNVNVEIQGGESFFIRLHPSQTVRDIKEIVQNLRGIPVRQQIILYNQQLLYDDLNVQGCFIHNGSHIIVQIHADAPSPAASSEHDSDFSTGRDLNLPPTPSSERHSEFPPPQPQVRDLNLLPSPPLLCDLNLPPSPAPPHDLIMPVSPPVRDLSLPPLRAPVLDLNLPPSQSPTPSPSPLIPSHLPPVPSPSPLPSPSTSDLTQQPTPNLQIPPFLKRKYKASDIPPWNPSLQLTETSNVDDPFDVGHFSSSPLLMPMPDTPEMVRETAESMPSPLSLPEMLPPPITSPSPSSFIPNPLPPVPKTVTVNVKVPQSGNRVRIESDRKETVLELKQKIVALDDMQGVPVDRIVLQLHSLSLELMDHVPLQDCAVSENSQIDVILKPPSEVGGSSRVNYRKLKVIVLPMRTNERIEIEVFGVDRVSMLRQKLEQLQLTQGFLLPEDGAYSFIYRQLPMNEEQSFDWHQVRNGDIIETFDGFETPSPSPSPKATRR